MQNTGVSVDSIVKLLVCGAYSGFVEAFKNGYVDICLPLIQTVKNIMVHRHFDFLRDTLKIDDLFVLEAVLYSY